MTTQTLNSMDELALSALKEVGNIGAGNAMTALATMLDQNVDMSVPRVGIIPLSEFALMTGGEETISVGVYMPVEGDAPGHVAFLWPEASALRLAEQLMGLPLGSTDSLDEVACSALTEVGNILASSYLVAIGEMTELNLLSCPPALAYDMTSAILSEVAAAFASMEDQALTITTHIGEAFGAVDGFFLYIPEPGSLKIMLHALQLDI
ncbi:MAG TPA: chemotaxis protein CheC [Chthonomonadaceae bacterium]|nr:chemotaxis protein CheC [Chthonomonadaceae bacterium]